MCMFLQKKGIKKQKKKIKNKNGDTFNFFPIVIGPGMCHHLFFTIHKKQYQLLEFNNSAKYISGKKGKQVYVFDYCK